MSDHWHYASEIHGAAEEHHRHHDLEREAAALQHTADELVREVREIRAALAGAREDLRDALNRIHQLEDRQPDCADPEAGDEAWRSTLADYQVASGVADDDPDCGCGLGAARCRDLEDGGPS